MKTKLITLAAALILSFCSLHAQSETISVNGHGQGLLLNNTSDDAGTYITITDHDGKMANIVSFDDNYGDSSFRDSLQIFVRHGKDFRLATSTDASAGTNKFVIQNSGYTGIGTMLPDRPLVVSSTINGQAAGESTILIEGQSNKERFGIHSYGGDPGFQASRAGGTIAMPAATPSNKYLSYLGGGGYDGVGWTGNNGLIAIMSSETFSNTNKGTYISFQTTQGSTTSRSEKVRITDSGNVGIGTILPTHKLSVNGTVRAKEVIVDTGWSDFVFEDSYRLRPLHEVELHIEEHGHLPDVPSAAVVESEGLSVGEAQKIMMQKIEELTLYVIDLQKQNNAQQLRIQELESK